MRRIMFFPLLRLLFRSLLTRYLEKRGLRKDRTKKFCQASYGCFYLTLI